MNRHKAISNVRAVSSVIGTPDRKKMHIAAVPPPVNKADPHFQSLIPVSLVLHVLLSLFNTTRVMVFIKGCQNVIVV
jgi:hypothetical protein